MSAVERKQRALAATERWEYAPSIESREIVTLAERYGLFIGGKEKDWTAEITEQRPDERVAWRSTSGARNAGVVTFHRLADRKTRVMLQLEYEPDGVTETVGDAVGVVGSRVARDLDRFKDFIENRQGETGAWRGEVPAKGL